VSKYAQDEIGILVDCFNHMVDKLEQRNTEIQLLNQNLERRVQEELKKSRQKDHILIQQSRLAAMGQMVGNIAHQWRQPLCALNILLYNIQDLFLDNELDEKTFKYFIQKGNELTNKMSTTIDDFRNFFKPNKKKDKFSINKVVKDTLSLIDASLKHYNISVVLNEEKEITTVGFPNEYSQVILNILNNARDEIVINGLKGEIIIDVYNDSEFATVKIKDNGQGIPGDIIDNIFDPYFSTKEKHKGSGIGLYMSKMIIEEHMCGLIEAQNNNGGAEFTIKTPMSTLIPMLSTREKEFSSYSQN
jgi:C4-dicarboxylate-specific signal transduction histidine kinase